MAQIEFISRPTELQKICQYFVKNTKKEHENFITMDTEFIRYNTYFPQLALIQIGTVEKAAVIDYTAFNHYELQPLFEIMSAPDIVKVFHSARQDCEALYHKLGIFPFPLFDTQIAAAMLGFGESIGYEPLVHSLLSIHMDKTCQQSPWLERPLTPQQIHYAAYDVIYLVDVYKILLERLKKLNRTSWVSSESLQLLKHRSYETDATSLWKKFPFLPQQWKEAFLMKYLLAWREAKAIEFNKPRTHLVSDRVFFDMCFNPHIFQKHSFDLLIQPQNRHSKFFSLPFWQHYHLFESLDRLLDQVHKTILQKTPSFISNFKKIILEKNYNHPHRSTKGHPCKIQIKKICQKCAEQNNIAISLFFDKKDVDLFFYDILKTHNPWLTTSRLSRGWRKELLKTYQNDLEKILNNL